MSRENPSAGLEPPSARKSNVPRQVFDTPPSAARSMASELRSLFTLLCIRRRKLPSDPASSITAAWTAVLCVKALYWVFTPSKSTNVLAG